MLALEFLRGASTVGELTHGALLSNSALLAQELGGFTTPVIWDKFCRVFLRQTGLSLEDLRLDARIVDELGID